MTATFATFIGVYMIFAVVGSAFTLWGIWWLENRSSDGYFEEHRGEMQQIVSGLDSGGPVPFVILGGVLWPIWVWAAFDLLKKKWFESE